MKTPLRIGLLLISTLALSTQAHAWENPPCKVNAGFRVYFKVQVGNATLPLAPWYLYFPAEAYQQPIGPGGFYPNWQPRPAPAAAFAFPQQPFVPSTPDAPPAGLQRTAYQHTGSAIPQTPAYWYGQ